MTDQPNTAPVAKQPSRRNFIQFGALALAGATFIPGTLSRALAQSTTTAGKVDVWDARDPFFSTTLYIADVMKRNYFDHYYSMAYLADLKTDMAGWQQAAPLILMDIDVDGFLRGKYLNAKNDEQRAAIVTFRGLGGVDSAKEAAAQAFSNASKVAYSQSLLDNKQQIGSGDYKTAYTLNIDAFDAAVDKFGNASALYGGKPMTFLAEVRQAAEDLLWSAYSGKYKTGSLDTFLRSDAMNHPAFVADIKPAATALGLRSDNTLVSNSTGPKP